MSVAGKISVRPLSELVCEESSNKSDDCFLPQDNKSTSMQHDQSPLKVKVGKRTQKRAATTSKKAKEQQSTTAPSIVKRSRTTKKQAKPDDRQKTIDSFFKSAAKNFKIEPSKEINSPKKRTPKKSRRRITYNDKNKSDTSVSNESKYNVGSMRKINKKPDCIIDLCILDSEDEEADKLTKGLEKPITNVTHSIQANKTNRRILSSSSQESESELTDKAKPPSKENKPTRLGKNRNKINFKINNAKRALCKNRNIISLAENDECANQISSSPPRIVQVNAAKEVTCSIIENSPPTTSATKKALSSSKFVVSTSGKENDVPETPSHSSLSCLKIKSEIICSTINETLFESTDIVEVSDDDFEYVPTQAKSNKIKAKNPRKTRSSAKAVEPEIKKPKRSPHPCPPYKIIEGTNGTMAVDAFRFGNIEGVTHYFLTHFHADHYIGLTPKFSHEIYMSSITARLIRAFIPIEEKYIKELELNVSVMIGDVEVTAIDANHCPGALMLIFKLRNGRCMLHTGDFRASSDMESEPIFWNNDIDTIYLDTTYISQKYAFCHQSDSIIRATLAMKEFIERNVGTKTLFVCGAYLIGKEKFWSALASHFDFKIYTEGNRKKALAALQDETLNSLLTENPSDAQMHVLPMQKLSYVSLSEYLDQYAEHFDLIFALRPSGWEKNSRPQYRGKINIFGVEYSEHSSHDELKRFVQYLKPQNVISTVPVNTNPMITSKVPQKWYKYTMLHREYQPSITSFFKMSNNKQARQLNEQNKGKLAENSNKSKKADSMRNEPIMMVSPCSAPEADDFDQTLIESIKPKQEILEKVPNLMETILIDCETDDDWMT